MRRNLQIFVEHQHSLSAQSTRSRDLRTCFFLCLLKTLWTDFFYLDYVGTLSPSSNEIWIFDFLTRFRSWVFERRITLPPSWIRRGIGLRNVWSPHLLHLTFFGFLIVRAILKPTFLRKYSNIEHVGQRV